MLVDSTQREQATDPRHSYIVQAPAGSGKTEILTQRFLRLLSTVQTPEQIIALTFTRKAANEMRERIVLALQQVTTGVPATSDHQKKTHAYAARALEKDQRLQWHLLQQPSRLRVITIDSLCQTITNAIPRQDYPIHYAEISDKPKAIYRDAARACLDFATQNTAYHQALKTLLRHLDNRHDRVLTLLSDLLAKRDQWLRPLYQARMQDKASAEEAIAFIEQHELTRFRQIIPLSLQETLIVLIRKLVCLTEQDHADPLRDWNAFEQLDGRMATRLAAILLTSQNTLRKAFDHHIGLKRGACLHEDYDELKNGSKQLLAQLAELPDFLDSFLRVSRLPNPTYDAQQWAVLQALFTLLPLLVAHLNLAFQAHNAIDFTAISQQALQALGEEQAPTDLALYLDNKIQHLLVDEFQDTSIQQFQLLHQLVIGWEPQDGRTLFLVGDPMQSIYRFRSAEVGLFLRTQTQGLGPVTLIPLELSCNFRSTTTIVDWVNRHFRTIFPKTHDIESGAVAFHPAMPIKPHDDTSYVRAFQFENTEAEAQALVRVVEYELQTYTEDKIAILVRSRRQLSKIMQLLRERQIPFQGVDIDLLAHLPHLRDVWSITEALLMPANRLAWLSVLRSPWCGLSLNDLLCIAHFSKSQSLYYALSQLENIPNISHDGRARASFVFSVLQTALMNRHQQPLVDWIIQTLQQLHLHHVLHTSQQDDLDQYWLLLERFEQEGQLSDLSLFKDEWHVLYSKKVTPSRLQIMTIHKSKGLEFDCVLLPGLSTKSSNRDTPLLRWLQLPTQQRNDLLLISPVKAAEEEACVLYDYLGQLDAQKNSYEQQRLLYVATTRAKKRLYLFDCALTSRPGSFRHLLQPYPFETADDDRIPQEISPHETHPPLYQLPLHYYQTRHTPDTPKTGSPRYARLTNSMPRLIGIVTHELLQWICTHHPQTEHDIPWGLAERSLQAMGFVDDALSQAMALLQKQITALWVDPIGQWLIQQHETEHNEYELFIETHGTIATRIIDRTFYDQGLCWIIDFKTGQDDKNNETRHREQVNEYKTILSPKTPLPIRCGLYYLASNQWVCWA